MTGAPLVHGALAALLFSVACGLNEDGLAPSDASAAGSAGVSGTGGSVGGSAGVGAAGGAGGAAASGGVAGIGGAAGVAGSGGVAASGGSGATAGAAGTGGSPPLPTCQELYGTLLTLIEICPSPPGQCKLAIDTDPNDGNPGQSCLDVCASKGATCIDLFDNNGEFCSENVNDHPPCDDESLSEGVCFCTHGP